MEGVAVLIEIKGSGYVVLAAVLRPVGHSRKHEAMNVTDVQVVGQNVLPLVVIGEGVRSLGLRACGKAVEGFVSFESALCVVAQCSSND